MKISICIATYNGEKYLKEQLDSILCQLTKNDEIIISDDGSTDNTISIISSYCDTRIKILHNNVYQNFKTKSSRVTKNFENALNYATGDYIFLSDQDDIWEKTKIISSLKLFIEKKINLIVHDAILIDNNNIVINDSYFKILHSKSGFVKNIIKNSYLGCCMAFDKNILIKTLPFPEKLIAHDIWIGLIAERIGKVAFIDNKMIYYRRHDSTVTSSGFKSSHSLFFKLNYRIQFLIMYLSRTKSLRTFKIKQL